MRSWFSGEAINCLDNCSARTWLSRLMSSWTVTNVISMFFCASVHHQNATMFFIVSWHCQWGIRRIQSRATTFHRIRLVPSILFIGIYSNQILVHDPPSQWNRTIVLNDLDLHHFKSLSPSLKTTPPLSNGHDISLYKIRITDWQIERMLYISHHMAPQQARA